jgi:hypothetical protein
MNAMRATIATLVLLSVAWCGATLAGEYALIRWTIDVGGIGSPNPGTGGSYALSGTVGQSDAGAMSGGGYDLTGGFWFGCRPADCDCDGDVDLDDFVALEACLEGPAGGLEAGCGCFDLDAGGDVDLFDFAAFQEAFTAS